MPLYEYECTKCHHRFEKIQKYSDPHTKKCPDCGARVELVISAPAAHFKGSGFYVTDYPNKSSRAPSSSASSSEGESSSKDSSSRDASSKDSSSKDSSSGDSSSKKESKPKTESKKAEREKK